MTEINIYFDFLISILKADGQVAKEEEDFIVNSALALGVSDIDLTDIKEKISDKGIDLDLTLEAIGKKANPSFTVNLLRDGYSVAKSDGLIDNSELQILKRLVQSFEHYSDDLFDELIDWCEESLYLKSMGNELILKVMGEK